MQIREDDLSHPAMIALLSAHYADAQMQNPNGWSHALDIDALKHPSIKVWSLWEENEVMGCGALREISAVTGEIKSMHVHRQHRRKGVSSTLLRHIINVSRKRGYKALKLETHPVEGYAPARALYEKFGFTYCDPFGSYEANPNSVFMSLKL